MRGLGCGATTTVPGLGTVTVGEPSVTAVTYKNEVRGCCGTVRFIHRLTNVITHAPVQLDTEVFASLPEQTREAILHVRVKQNPSSYVCDLYYVQ